MPGDITARGLATAELPVNRSEDQAVVTSMSDRYESLRAGMSSKGKLRAGSYLARQDDLILSRQPDLAA
jgi:hypothetical protein